ncbi:MAG: alpha/beta fold hydrolase [Rectinema sp.]
MAEMMINGVRIVYELSGENDVGSPKAPIILLNGIAMSVSHWKPVIAALPARTRCLCHDFRGQTLSDKPAGPYSLAMHAGDLTALMDALGIEKGHIVGTSYGSEVAMEFAILYPERCGSLMVIDGVSELDPVLEAAVISWMESAGKDARLFYKTMLPWTYSSNYIATHRDILAAREAGVAALPAEWFVAFVELCRAFLEIDQTPRLKQIRCPTTVLVGEKDILKHRGFSEIIARNIPGAVMHVISDAGHAVVIERPALCAEEIWQAVSLR